MPSKPALPTNEAVLTRALCIVWAFAAVYLVFAILRSRAGDPIYLLGALGPPDDLFADFFKLIVSYPGGSSVVPSRLGELQALIHRYQLNNPYTGVEGLANAHVTHLNLPPLTMLFCQLSLMAMRAFDPAACFAVIVLAILTAWITVVYRAARHRDARIAGTLLALLSYPMLIMVARGNVYAGITGVLLVGALLASLDGKTPILAALLLAIAINLRPNALPFALPIMLMHRRQIPVVSATLAVAVAGIYAASLAAAHGLYPDYTLATFRAGLVVYYRSYVVGDAGLGFGSSLFGAMKLFIGYHPWLDVIAALPSVAILAAVAVLGWLRRLTPTETIFLAAAAYTLGSSVIADYHLLVFLAPPLALARSSRLERPGDRIALVASCLMLAPKHYLFRAGISSQVLLNPLILLGSSLAILWLACARSLTDHRDDPCTLWSMRSKQTPARHKRHAEAASLTPPAAPAGCGPGRRSAPASAG